MKSSSDAFYSITNVVNGDSGTQILKLTNSFKIYISVYPPVQGMVKTFPVELTWVLSSPVRLCNLNTKGRCQKTATFILDDFS